MNRLWISLWVGGAVLCAANSLSGTGIIGQKDTDGRATAKEEKILSTRLAEEEAPRAKAAVETSREITGSVGAVPVRTAKAEPERARVAPPVASKKARAEQPIGKADTKPTLSAAAAGRVQEVQSPGREAKGAESPERAAADVQAPDRNPKATKQGKKRWAKKGGRRGHLRRWGYGPPDPRLFMMRPYPPYAGRIYAIPPYAVRRYHYW